MGVHRRMNRGNRNMLASMNDVFWFIIHVFMMIHAVKLCMTLKSVDFYVN